MVILSNWQLCCSDQLWRFHSFHRFFWNTDTSTLRLLTSKLLVHWPKETYSETISKSWFFFASVSPFSPLNSVQKIKHFFKLNALPLRVTTVSVMDSKGLSICWTSYHWGPWWSLKYQLTFCLSIVLLYMNIFSILTVNILIYISLFYCIHKTF